MKTIRLDKPTLGQDTVSNIRELDSKSLRSCINLDIHNDGILASRDGYTKVYNGTNCHSLYKGVFVAGGTLRLVSDKSGILGGVGNDPLSYVEINDLIYFSNNNLHGKLNSGFQYVTWRDRVTSGNSEHNSTRLTLEEQHLTQLPLGNKLMEFKGRLYVVNDKIIYFSEPLNYDLTREAQNWLQYEDNVTCLAKVESGIFVSTKYRTYFLEGTDFTNFKQSIVGEGAHNGEPIYVHANDLGIDDYDYKLPVWVSVNGFVVGLPNGTIQQVTKDRISFNTEESFVIGYREKDGIKQIVASVSGGTDTQYGASDRATMSIQRNGVTI
jgi:hypothetical protein